MIMAKRSSLACPQYHHHHRDQAHLRLTSAITAPQTPRWRPPATGDYASQPLTGTRRAALLGTCARARATRRHAPSCEEEADGLRPSAMSVLSQHRSHQGGQASQRNPALPVSKRALRAADLPPPLLGSRPNTRNPPPGGRPGSEWQRHPRHRPRVADQSHDRDRRVKKKPPRCNTPIPS